MTKTYRLNKTDIRQRREGLFQTLTQVSPSLHTLLSARLVEHTKWRQSNSQIVLTNGLGHLLHQLKHKLAALL